MSFLVLGGTGYIGSHAVNQLINNNYHGVGIKLIKMDMKNKHV